MQATQPGEYAFDIKLQGLTVDKVVETFKSPAGRPRTMICKFGGISVDRDLVIDIVPKRGDMALCAVKVTRRESSSPKVAAASN
jgi:hypothetical protein